MRPIAIFSAACLLTAGSAAAQELTASDFRQEVFSAAAQLERVLPARSAASTLRGRPGQSGARSIELNDGYAPNAPLYPDPPAPETPPAPAPAPPPPAVAPPSAPPAVASLGSTHELYFDLGSARLGPQGAALLNAMAVTMADPRLQGFRFLIVGHTDASGPPRLNRQLSLDRARMVVRELLRRGVPADRLLAMGLGSSRLKAPGRPCDPVNRRVEIELEREAWNP